MKSIADQILKDIPIAKFMGFEVLSLSQLESRAQLPLKPNKNHLGTLFGGSLYSASALGCYASLLFALDEKKIKKSQIVIVNGEIQYLRPGQGDSQVRAWTTQEELNHFFEELSNKNKARIRYEAKLSAQGKTLSHFKGLYQVDI